MRHAHFTLTNLRKSTKLDGELRFAGSLSLIAREAGE